jgi:hypothetical protein
VFSGPNHAVIIVLCTVDGVALEKFLFALLLVVEIISSRDKENTDFLVEELACVSSDRSDRSRG